VYAVCLATDLGDEPGRGEQGSPRDPDLVGHVWAGPFLALEPQHCLILEDDEGVAGYCLATASTRDFEAACEREWWPPLRQRYADPTGPPETWTRDQALAHFLYRPPESPADVVAAYPAQLHIDLLPRTQGRGHGTELVTAMFGVLAAAGAGGVHLGVGHANTRARAFYRKLGFAELGSRPTVVWMGRPLP
jgi:ribosomal protein S18 acetylase RimI-like enzyme